MSVLETFFFQFEADGAKLKKGLDEADKSADNTEKGLQKADQSAGKLGANLEKLALSAGKALAGLFALHELKKITQETADHTYEVAQQARAMDMNVESLSAWQQSVKASGGTAEAATESVKGLRDKFVEMARFGGMMGPEAMMFQQLGLSAKDMHASIKDPMVAMGKLADTFGTLDRTKALFLGKKLGLDQGTINLLMQGRRGLDEMMAKQKELGVVTEAQAEAATKFKLKQTELGIVFESLARQTTGALLPALTWLMDKIEVIIGFLQQHKAFAIGLFAALGTAITVLALPPMIELAVAIWAALAPFLAIAAVIAVVGTAIAFVADDIYTFIQGGDSLIGRAVQKWPILGQIFKAIGEIINMWWTQVKANFAFLVKLFTEDIPGAAEAMRNKITGAIDALVKKFPFIGEALKILKVVMGNIVDGMLAPWKILWDIISKVFDLIVSAPVAVLNLIGKGLAASTGGHYDEVGGAAQTNSMVEAGKKQLAATNTPFNSMNSQSISNSTQRGGSNISMGPIAVHTQATSGPAVAQAIGDSMKGHLKNAADQFDDGIAG